MLCCAGLLSYGAHLHPVPYMHSGVRVAGGQLRLQTTTFSFFNIAIVNLAITTLLFPFPSYPPPRTRHRLLHSPRLFVKTTSPDHVVAASASSIAKGSESERERERAERGSGRDHGRRRAPFPRFMARRAHETYFAGDSQSISSSLPYRERVECADALL